MSVGWDLVSELWPPTSILFAPRWCTKTDSNCGMILRGGKPRNSDRNLSHCHFTTNPTYANNLTVIFSEIFHSEGEHTTNNLTVWMQKSSNASWQLPNLHVQRQSSVTATYFVKKTLKILKLNYLDFMKFTIYMLSGSLVTTAWWVHRLQTEGTASRYGG
jgi:hypothetical protein